MKLKYYLGLYQGKRRVFRFCSAPTEATHGEKFDAVVGPFRTKRAAYFMAWFGKNNPHCRSVADAERLAKTNIVGL